MNPGEVIAALRTGTASQPQRDWAAVRLRVLRRDAEVFGRWPEMLGLSPEEQVQLTELEALLGGEAAACSA